MKTVELEMEDVVHILQTQKELLEHQKRVIADLKSSRAGSEAPGLVRGEGLDRAFQRLTLDQQQDTEKTCCIAAHICQNLNLKR